MLRVWGRETSISVQKVMWLVGEMNLAHERIDAGGKFGRLDSPEFQALCPHPRIPVIEDNGAVVWESNACLRYLAAQYQAETLWPTAPAPAARARVDRWMEWSQNHWLAALQGLFWIYVRTPHDKRRPDRISEATDIMTGLTRAADGWLATRPYIAGDDLSLADFVFGTAMFRFHTLEFQRIEAPNIRAYYDRLAARPAYTRHVAIDYEELRAPGAERRG